MPFSFQPLSLLRSDVLVYNTSILILERRSEPRYLLVPVCSMTLQLDVFMISASHSA